MVKMTSRKNRLTATHKQNRDLLRAVHRFVAEYSPTPWLRENPKATLGQLKERVEEAVDQCIQFGDERIPDHQNDIPAPLSEELAEWELPEDEEDQTFDYRVENLQEISEHLDELIEWLGDDFEVVGLWPYGKPTGKGEILIELIHEYLEVHAEGQRKHHNRYQDFPSLSEAIKHSTGVVGKVPDHQRRVGLEVLMKACSRLLRSQDKIKTCMTFDELLDLVEQRTAGTQRFGILAVYDITCRLGTYLGLEPEVVYLHAGTARGAKALGMDTSRGYLEMDELPKPFRLLEPCECENFLCIYKVRLAAIRRKPKGRSSKERPVRE